MLTSIRQIDDYKVHAQDVDKSDAPFSCPVCGRETILRKGRVKTHHFAHKPPVLCEYGKGESEAHRQCKQSIYDALKLESGVTDCELEKNFGLVVSDIFFIFNGIKVAIEVQVSSLTMDRIIARTKAYERLGIYVLWLPLFDEKLNNKRLNNRYAPKIWEKWLHATYFGHVYYWLHDLSVIPIHFNEYLIDVEATDWGGGYYRTSKRFKTTFVGSTLNILNDFEFRDRKSWEGGNVYIPKCKILVYNREVWWNKKENNLTLENRHLFGY
jgi:competence protein CoiA